MKYQKLTVVSDLVFTGEQSRSRKDWGEAEGAEIPVVLGNRIRGKAFRHSKDRGSVTENREVQELGFNGKWHPGEEEGQEGFSQVGMKSEVLQDLLNGAAGSQGEEERKPQAQEGIILKPSCPDFRRYFRCFSSENTNVLSNTCAHLNNKRKN